LIHIRLFGINPLFALVPTFIIMVLMHFMLNWGKAAKKLEMSRTAPNAIPEGEDKYDMEKNWKKPRYPGDAGYDMPIITRRAARTDKPAFFDVGSPDLESGVETRPAGGVNDETDSDLITLSDDENVSETESVDDDKIVPLLAETNEEAAERVKKQNEAAFAKHMKQMEMQCILETTMLANVRAVIPHQVQFIVHGDQSGFLIAFYTHKYPNEQEQILHCVKLPEKECASGGHTIEMFTLEEDDLNKFKVDHVENDERDFPKVVEMPVPFHLAGASASSVGNFVGAISFPLMKNVVFDVWRTADGISWTTTTVDSYIFTVIEHVQINYSEEEIADVMQIYGRHCKKGHLLTEAYEIDE